jgi:hypothetical protein
MDMTKTITFTDNQIEDLKTIIRLQDQILNKAASNPMATKERIQAIQKENEKLMSIYQLIFS